MASRSPRGHWVNLPRAGHVNIQDPNLVIITPADGLVYWYKLITSHTRVDTRVQSVPMRYLFLNNRIKFTSHKSFVKAIYGIMTWTHFPHSFCGWNPTVFNGFPSQRPVTEFRICFVVNLGKLLCQQLQLPVIWDATSLMWHHCKV